MRSTGAVALLLTLRFAAATVQSSLRGAPQAAGFANTSTPTLRVVGGGAAHQLVENVTRPAGSYPARVEGTFGPAGDMQRKLLDGEPCDVVILTDAIVGELVSSGHAVNGSEGSLGFVATALAQLRGAGSAAPRTAEELRELLSGASALHVPDMERSTAGRHVAEVLERLELSEAPRVIETPEGGLASMQKLAESGDAEALGCTQVTEILAVPGIQVLGELPPGYRLRTSYVAAVCAGAAEPEHAQKMVQALAGADAVELRRALGFIDE